MLALEAPPAHVTAIGIGEREYAIAVYRPTVRPGRLQLAVHNLGEDVHDLVVRRAGHTYGTLGTVKPGATSALRLTLRHPGRYTLVCTIADHAARGMRATLRVRRPVARRRPEDRPPNG
jgi:plastocyanin